MTRKRTIRETHGIHPNAPSRLVAALHKHGWNQRALARTLGINSGHITKLIRNGEEPSDATQEGRELRQALFLPRHKKIPRRPVYTCQTYSQYIGSIISIEGKKIKKAINEFKRGRG